MKPKREEPEKSLALLLLAPLLFASCSGPSEADYLEIRQDGIRKIPYAEAIERNYGDVDHFITHFGWGKQPLTWNTETHFLGRFTLTMQIPVTVDYRLKTLSTTAEPVFYLHAAQTVKKLPDGRFEIHNDSSLQREFGLKEWLALEAAGFDLGALGIPKSKIHPVAGFDDYLRSLPKD